MSDKTKIERLKEIIREHKSTLLSIPNVHGISIGYKAIKNDVTDQIALIAHVHQKVERSRLKDGELFDNVVKKINSSIVTDVIERGLPIDKSDKT